MTLRQVRKWYMCKNGTTVVYGGYNKICRRKHCRCLAAARQRFHAEVFSYEIDAERTLRLRIHAYCIGRRRLHFFTAEAASLLQLQ